MVSEGVFPRVVSELLRRDFKAITMAGPLSGGLPTAEREASDHELLQGIVRRDEASLAALYDRYGSLLLALAMRILGDRGESEDVLQKVFVKVWTDAARYDALKATVRIWLVSCLRHAAIDQARRRGIHRKLLREAEAHDVKPDPRPAWDESHHRIARAVEALPPDQREAIDLAYFEGLSQSEIASRLEQPLGTVKTRIRLGMAKLREALSGLVKERS